MSPVSGQHAWRHMKRMEEIKTHSCAIPNGIHIPLWRTLHAQLRIHLYRLLVHLIWEQTRNLQDIIQQNGQHMQYVLLFKGRVWRTEMGDERRVMPTRAVNGFIAIPVLQSTKLVGIECLTIAPVSGSFALYSTWSGCTDATLNSVTIMLCQ